MAHDPKDCMFSAIDTFINTLDGVKNSLDSTFISLQNTTQQELDRIIEEEINPKINAQLEALRSSLISTLQSMYKGFLSLSQKLMPVQSSSPTDLGSVISFCLAVKDFICGMYETVMQFTILLTEHLVLLNNAITSIVSYSPPIQGLDFSKLDIKMQSISMADITG